MITTQFINDCISGEENAIQTLIRTHQRGVFQLVLSVIDDAEKSPQNSVEEAEAATRDTFIRALDRLPRYREDIPFTTWLYTIAIEVARKRMRSMRIRRALSGLFSRESNFYATPAHPDANPGDEAMWQTVRKLKEEMRIPVVLRYYHDYPISEIARLLHISEGAVHARLDAARERIGAG